jgi:5'(3')-deoxyribonucleotidase
MKKVVYIDMDGVIVDFGHQVEKVMKDPQLSAALKSSPDQVDGIFKDPPPIKGAIESITKLHNSGRYDLFIATTAPWDNPGSLTDKRLWIEKHFSDLFKKKMFITHRKDMLIGDYLIDDRLANGAGNFNGSLLRFGWDYENKEWNQYRDWDSILKFLL